MVVTEDALLDGRLAYLQPRDGFRTGIEPILLAAFVPVRPGDMVLEVGTGAGAGLLCLARRVPDIRGVGVERDPDLCALARHNARRNGLGQLSVVAADVRHLPLRPSFDHAFANPPYHLGAGSRSPNPGRDMAKRADPETFATWTRAMALCLRERGSLSLVCPVAWLTICLSALTAARCAVAELCPLWPRAGMAAKLILVRGVRGGRMPVRLSAGLVLHTADGHYTPQATAVLRGGQALVGAVTGPG